MKKNQASKHSLLKINNLKESDYRDLQTLPPFKLQAVRQLTESAYVLRFEKNGISFRAGQHITLGLPGDNQIREYSIYSTEQDPMLEVLIKEVDEGIVSKRLHHCRPGEYLSVEGPLGVFMLDERSEKRSNLFIASGTGIAPFHSMAGSYPQLDYTILHGVRYKYEAYEHEFYNRENYILCTSRDTEGDFNGRVTDYVRKNPVSSETLVYLCGNCNMIYEVYDILMDQHFPAENIKTEVYF